MTKVNLTPVFDSLVAALPDVSNEEDRFMSLANTRARLRMTSLYYFAALKSLLVAGTGNKVEDFGVGFYTKYGDGGVDLSPIADLMKSEVYALAAYMGVHQEIIEAAPTDGLWGDDRTDEDQIGASYDELEWAMHHLEQKADDKGLSDRQKEVLRIYNKLHKANLHKMVAIPVCDISEDLKSSV
jgi:NAD+ synthase